MVTIVAIVSFLHIFGAKVSQNQYQYTRKAGRWKPPSGLEDASLFTF